MTHPIPNGWVEAPKGQATHLFHGDRPWDPQGWQLIPIKSGTMDYPYGLNSGTNQDLVDRGHGGWVRVKRARKESA